MIALLLAVLAATDPIRGAVVDPHQRPVAGAVVTIACAELARAADTNEQGRFAIHLDRAGVCDVRVTHPGFEPLTRALNVPVSTPLTFELAPANWEERVEVVEHRVTPSQAATSALGGTALTADVMRVAGPDPARWLTLAQRAAGQPIGTYALTINGMPAAALPPAGAIASIGAALDPFSVETGGADRVMVDIISDPPGRWQFAAAPGIFTTRQHDVLLPEASQGSQHRGLGAGGPMTRSGELRAAVSAETTRSWGRPTYIERTGAGDRLTSSVDSSTQAGAWAGELAWRHGPWQVHGSLAGSRSSVKNGGIGGRSGPPGAIDIDSSFRREQLMWRRTGRRLLLRGGVSSERVQSDVSSLSTGAGYVFAERLLEGAPDALGLSRRSSSTTVRAIASSPDAPIRGWLIGIEAARSADREFRRLNPSGQIFVSSPSTLIGPRVVRTGSTGLAVRTPSAAAFAQRVIANTSRVWARVGIRAEWQQDFGVVMSPRLALGLRTGAFFIGANAGTFSDLWSAADGLERKFRVHTSGSIQSGASIIPLLFAGDGARRRDTVIRGSLTRPFRGGSIGIEETVRLGASLTGLMRQPAGDTLIDLLDHSRTLTRRQTRVRLDLTRRRWLATAFYEHAYARDTTDGPFALAAGPDLDAERGPSSGIPAHAATATLSGSLRRIRLLISARRASGTPYSLLSGHDPQGLFTFNGRWSNSRNRQRTPASSDLSAYVARQFPLPVASINVDAGVRFENLLGAVSALDIERSATSALAGRPVSAARGRTISAWMTLGRR